MQILLRKVCSDITFVASHPGPHLDCITTVASALLVVNLAGVMRVCTLNSFQRQSVSKICVLKYT